MFSAADLVFKNGGLVVRDGEIVSRSLGDTHAARPEYDPGIERTVRAHFDRYYSLRLDNFKVAADLFSDVEQSRLVEHPVA